MEKVKIDKTTFLEKIDELKEESSRYYKTINLTENESYNINNSINNNNINDNNINDNNIDSYTIKKVPVMILLIKIGYWAIVIILFFIGINYLHKSKDPKYYKEEKNFKKISEEWNETKYNDLQDWKIYLKNEKNDTLALDKSYLKYNTFTGSNKLYYRPFEFIKNNTVSLLRKINLNKQLYESSYGGYNLTSKLYLIIDNSFSNKTIKLDKIDFFIKKLYPNLGQSECNKEKGSWNYESGTCYKYYMLRTLCIIIDQKKRELYYDYKNFKCNGFNSWYQSYIFFPWKIPNFDPSFDDIEANGKKISLYLSTNFDPFVYATYNETFQLNYIYKSYNRIAVWCFTLTILLILIPFGMIVRDYYFIKKNHITNENIEILNQSFKTNPMRF